MQLFPSMGFSVLTLTLVLSACGGSPPPLREAPAPDPTVAIVGATLWDGTGRAPVSQRGHRRARRPHPLRRRRPASARSRDARESSTPRASISSPA